MGQSSLLSGSFAQQVVREDIRHYRELVGREDRRNTMRTLTTPLLALFLAAASLSACGDEATSVEAFAPGVERSPVVADAPADEWVAGINQAGWEFHQTIEGNAISSPISLGAAFSLLRAGASEPTDAVLDGIFGFPAGDGTHTAANAVLTDLEA